MIYEYYQPAPDRQGSTLLEWWAKEKPSDREYVKVYEGVLDDTLAGGRRFATDSVALEFLFKLHNVGENEDGERPLAKKIRSMSVGDIVKFHDSICFPLRSRTYLCEPMGWRRMADDELPGSVREG